MLSYPNSSAFHSLTAMAKLLTVKIFGMAVKGPHQASKKTILENNPRHLNTKEKEQIL